MANKFLDLVEGTINKMTNGGILVGDRVALVSGYKSKDSFKQLSDDIKEYIEKMFNDSDLNKKVINIKTNMPSRAPGNEDNRAGAYTADVAVELATGLYDNQNAVSIPLDCLECDTGGADIEFGKAPVPDSVKYDNKVQIDPKEVGEEDEIEITRMTQQGDTLKPTEIYLPKQNTKIPSKGAVSTDNKAGNYTVQYMV